MKTKKEILDGLNYHIEQLQELNKVHDAVKELGVMDNQYARMMLSIKLSEKLKELHTSAWMLDHYMEQLNQLEEGTIDNDEPVTEDDLPFDGKEEKE